MMAVSNFLKRYKFSLTYFLLVPLVNWAFSWAPVWPLPDGGGWTPFAIVTGLVLVFRDFAQREIGHNILFLLLAGVAISYFMAAPEIAIVSGIAFLVSELVDWAVYTLSERPLSRRIIISSLISAPLDTTIFLYGADMVVPGIFTHFTLVASVLSKLLGAAFVAYLVAQREKTLSII
jgi:uncharacterized PurR-regulated membrane protein YhhQ (DUF165 family)